jgi:hypothetical protein
MEPEYYGNFVDIESSYPTIYPDNLQQMKKKYNINKNIYENNKKYNFHNIQQTININVHIMKTIHEDEYDNTSKKYENIIAVTTLQYLTNILQYLTNIHHYIILYAISTCFLCLYVFIYHNLL